ncbi:MAG: class I SAM-dependent methyltransferase [Pseudomonadota bacterium]
MRRLRSKGFSDKAFSGTPGALAFLVAESRARITSLSRDNVAHQWTPARIQSYVRALYDDYMDQVYRLDPYVLAARNRFVLNEIERSLKGATVVLAPCGLASYPYLTENNRLYVEIDLEEVVEFRTERTNELFAAGNIPSRKIKRIQQDLTAIRRSDDLDEWFPRVGQKIVVLEGISYYLTKEDWWRLVNLVFRRLSAGDVLIFDYWPKSEENRRIYKKFLRFCERNSGYSFEAFNFIEPSEIKAAFYKGFSGEDVKIETKSVRDICLNCFKEDKLRKADILNDTLVKVSKASTKLS